MMKIKILVSGPYTDFESEPRFRAVMLEAGAVVERPEWYARDLVESGLASVVGDSVVADSGQRMDSRPTLTRGQALRGNDELRGNDGVTKEFKASEYKSRRRRE